MRIDKNIDLHGNSLRLVFTYNNARCLENLGLPNTKANIVKAQRIRDDIIYEIRNKQFDYGKHFPESKMAQLFSVKPKSYLLKDLLEQQIKLIEDNKKYSKFTKRDYLMYINNYLIPYFGKTVITELKALDIKNWILDSKQSANFIGNLLLPLRATLADALNDGIINENPLSKVDTKRLFQLKEKHSDYKVVPFTQEERICLIDNAQGEIKNFIKFAMFSGLRIGEIIALRWCDVDLNKKTIYVNHTMNNGSLERTKTESSTRELNLFDNAYDSLVEQLEFKNEDDFVFHNPNTGAYWPKTDSFRKHWVNLIKICKIEYRNPYQMRHTFASMLISNSENIQQVAEYLGHVNIKMVTEIYGKFIPNNKNSHGFKNIYNF